jgi:hypothetical protein
MYANSKRRNSNCARDIGIVLFIRGGASLGAIRTYAFDTDVQFARRNMSFCNGFLAQESGPGHIIGSIQARYSVFFRRAAHGAI